MGKKTEWTFLSWSGLQVAIITLCWYMSSSLANNFSKAILGTFHSPSTLTYVQFVFKALLSATLLAFQGKFHILPWRQFIAVVGPLGIGNMLSHWLTHVSTSFLAVSFTQTIKAAAPLFAVFLSIRILGERYSTFVMLSLLPIVLGVTMCTLTEVNFNLIGFLAAISATMVFVIQNMYSKKLFKDLECNNVQLVMWVSLGALAVMTPMWLFENGHLFYDPSPLHAEVNGTAISQLLVYNAIAHWLQTILAFKVLSMVTPVTYSVANSCKRIFVIISSVLYFQNPITWVNACGIVLASVGVFLYNHARVVDRNKKLAAELPIVIRA